MAHAVCTLLIEIEVCFWGRANTDYVSRSSSLWSLHGDVLVLSQHTITMAVCMSRSNFTAWSSPQHILRLHRSKQSHFGMLYLERAAPARQDKIALLLFWKTNDLTANGCLLIQTEFSHLAYRGIFKPLRCVVLLCINRLQIRDSVGLLAPCVQHSKWLLLSSSSNHRSSAQSRFLI